MFVKGLLFLATEKGYRVLKSLIENNKEKNIGAVITFKEVDVEKSWDEDIRKECQNSNIPFYLWNDVKYQLCEVVEQNKCNFAIAISWRYLISLQINNYLEYPLIIFHDSLLPKYRGFAPTPTAIICGESVIGITAIFANKQVDNGDIIIQKSLYISKDMFMYDIIHKQSYIYAEMLLEIVNKIETGRLSSFPQNEDEATYSVWRNIDDCHIDWGKSAKDIYNFIRALSSPYPGAFSFINGKKIKIFKAEVVPYDLKFAIRDVGKIWTIKDNQPEVICGKGLLKILLAKDEKDEKVLFEKVRCKLQ